ncbi:hypothetical protein BRADI_1g54946v3 [Brachypodium distachyon]|uniref:Uncharacterized protein n=1 Tax=Brachypodium distachyon TaxID=15368 RepID=A0A2K2DRF3_BRADI|nr:hypothetical protein BRADI_1g54946v3 [Brachypodium distachyon]
MVPSGVDSGSASLVPLRCQRRPLAPSVSRPQQLARIKRIHFSFFRFCLSGHDNQFCLWFTPLLQTSWLPCKHSMFAYPRISARLLLRVCAHACA